MSRQRLLFRMPEDWLSSCGRDGGRPSPGTRRAYLTAFRKFGAWLTDSDDQATQCQAVADLLPSKNHATVHQVLRTWRDDLLASGASVCTVNLRLSALSSLWNWARRCRLTSFHFEDLWLPVERRTDRRGPSTPEVVAMLATCGTDPIGRRDAFIIRAARNLGLRRSEIVGLRLEDIGDGELRVLGKGRRERVAVALDPATAASLAAWLEARGNAPGPLIVRLNRGAPPLASMSGEAIRQMVDRRAKQAGLDKTVRPHGLRHCGATAVAQKLGLDGRIKEWGRWKSIGGVVDYVHSWSTDKEGPADVAI